MTDSVQTVEVIIKKPFPNHDGRILNAGDKIKIETDSEGTPLHIFWRNRFREEIESADPALTINGNKPKQENGSVAEASTSTTPKINNKQ